MKKLMAVLLCLALVAGAVFAEGNPLEEAKTEISKTFNAMVSVLDGSVVANAVQHNVTADAYIGKVFPSVLPHVGMGITTSVMLAPVEGLDLGALGLPAELSDTGFPIPSVTGNGRIGGIILPFDVGFSYLSLPETELTGGIKAGYDTLGVDVRYALMEQGLIKPNISVGFGYTQTKGQITMDLAGILDDEENVDAAGTMGFEASIVTLSAQVSKDVLFLTPFAGARCSLASEKYYWSVDGEIESEAIELGDSKSYAFGARPDVQVYAGLGTRFLILDTTLSVTYDVTTKATGATLGFGLSL